MSTFTIPPSRSRTKAMGKADLNATQNLADPEWEQIDPVPDIHVLFQEFDKKFFNGRLVCVHLEWSQKMYSCAGICYSRRNNFGSECTIRLSAPLLKFRPRKDLVETLLHEMIHAFCFINGIREGNGGHGPNFIKMMNSINQRAGTKISVYHNFHDEVNLYKVHWWRCNGPCVNRSPYYGFVKRTANRAPGPNDNWWSAHQQTCGGQFIKVKEPEKKKRTSNKENKAAKANNSTSDIRKFFSPTGKTQSTNTQVPKLMIPKAKETGNIKQFKDLNDSSDSSPIQSPPVQLFKGNGYVLGGSGGNQKKSRLLEQFEINIVVKKPKLSHPVSVDPPAVEAPAVEAPAEAPQNIKQELERDFDTDDIIMIDDEFDESFEIPAGDTSLIDKYWKDDVVDLTGLDMGFDWKETVKISNPGPSTNGSLGGSVELEKSPVKSQPIFEDNDTEYQNLKDCGYTEEEIQQILGTKNLPTPEKDVCSTPKKDALPSPKKVACPSCHKQILEKDVNTHLDNCLNDVVLIESPVAGPSNIQAKSPPGHVDCPVCQKPIQEELMNDHLDRCLEGGN